jgi:hypothetical protein
MYSLLSPTTQHEQKQALQQSEHPPTTSPDGVITSPQQS